MNLSRAITMTLRHEFLNAQIILYIDDFYNTLSLIQTLLEKHTLVYGKLRENSLEKETEER